MVRRSLTPRFSKRLLTGAATTLRVLSHPVRLKLVECLAQNEATVGELATELKQPHYAISQHLNQMRLNGLLTRRRSGREAYYRIRDKSVLDILDWIRKRQSHHMTFTGGEGI